MRPVSSGEQNNQQCPAMWFVLGAQVRELSGEADLDSMLLAAVEGQEAAVDAVLTRLRPAEGALAHPLTSLFRRFENATLYELRWLLAHCASCQPLPVCVIKIAAGRRRQACAASPAPARDLR